MLPPVSVMEIAVPEAEAPITLASENGTVPVTPDARVTFTMATTPLETVSAFNPASRHIYDPALPEQTTDLPAAVAAVPAVMLIDAISAAGYVSVH